MSVHSKKSPLIPTGGVRVPLPAWRSEWGKPRPAIQTVAATTFFAIVTLVFIPYIIDAAESGNATRAAFGLVAVFMGMTFVAAGIPHLRARRKRIPRNIVVHGTGGEVLGLRVRLVRYWRATLFVWLVAGMIFLLVRAALFLEQLLTHSDQGHGDRVTFDALAIMISIAVAGLLATVFAFLFIGPSDNSLMLNKDGVLRIVGPVTVSVSWDDVDQIWPQVVNNVNCICLAPRPDREFKTDIVKNRMLRLGRNRGDGRIVLPAISFGIDPALLLCLLAYYKEHPEQRHELESKGALDRIKSGRLVGLEH
ncbi:hypothetical protein ACFO5K_13620 [Nocardia halotolerans]|uniref:RDD family protein n=1 Tax=Nocardia halotolerans TaxID=1755878 RepID=A0ABV8VGK0_9NOCA